MVRVARNKSVPERSFEVRFDRESLRNVVPVQGLAAAYTLDDDSDGELEAVMYPVEAIGLIDCYVEVLENRGEGDSRVVQQYCPEARVVSLSLLGGEWIVCDECFNYGGTYRVTDDVDTIVRGCCEDIKAVIWRLGGQDVCSPVERRRPVRAVNYADQLRAGRVCPPQYEDLPLCIGSETVSDWIQAKHRRRRPMLRYRWTMVRGKGCAGPADRNPLLM